MVEMGNQSATINAQIGQAKSETERIKAQVQVFQNSTVAGNEPHESLRSFITYQLLRNTVLRNIILCRYYVI